MVKPAVEAGASVSASLFRARHKAAVEGRATVSAQLTLVRIGPAFAAVVPLQFTVETHAPESGHHLQPKPNDMVEGATGFVIMVVVVLMLMRQVVVWIMDEAGKVLARFSGDEPMR